MKFQSLQPTEGQFTYDAADRIVNFAIQNEMKVRGHTLVWHSQNPSWLFDNATKETLLTRMRTHISNVVRHYKGKVYAWDVVNEAVMEDGSYRSGNLVEDQKSRWYEIVGESYIAEAFKAAHEADPDAKAAKPEFVVGGGALVSKVPMLPAESFHVFTRDGVQYAVFVFPRSQRTAAQIAEMLQTAMER